MSIHISSVAARTVNGAMSVFAKQGTVNRDFVISMKNGEEHKIQDGYFVKWDSDELFVKGGTKLEDRPSGLSGFLGTLFTDFLRGSITVNWEDIDSIEDI